MAAVEVSALFVNNTQVLMVNVSCEAGIEKVEIWSKLGRVPIVRKPPADCPRSFEILLNPYPHDWFPVTVDVVCCDTKKTRLGPYNRAGDNEPGSVDPDTSKPPGPFTPPPPKAPGEKTNGKENE